MFFQYPSYYTISKVENSDNNALETYKVENEADEYCNSELRLLKATDFQSP